MPATSYSESHDVPPGIIPALRILCLHNSGSNAAELSDRLEILGERLYEKHAIDLVYVNSPLMIRNTQPKQHSSSNDKAKSQLPTSNNFQRIWWDEQREQGKYDGLDASLLLVRQVWTSMPFWGILGVGHGAAVGSFLPLMPDLPPPAFCIFVNGETLLGEENDNERLMDHLPCLHVLAPNPGPSSERLLKQFGGQIHQGGSNFTKPTINAIGKFIVDQKKLLRHQTEDTKILALQNMLYIKEQEAATAVAQHIAANPPKALTAVISPQSVGGFSGGRKRNPEGTGGAPCPPEFLLKKEKRPTHDGSMGPSREHPHQQEQSSQSSQQQKEEEEEVQKEKEKASLQTQESNEKTAETAVGGDQ